MRPSGCGAAAGAVQEDHEREISGATFCMSEKSAKKLAQKMQKLRREALRMAKDDNEAERAFRLNLQLFPVSRKMPASGDVPDEQEAVS